NLIIHNVSRNFRGKVEGTETADFTNNVIYNWAYQTAYGTIGHLNYVNNTLKMGNGTTGGKHYVNVDSSTKPQNFGIFLKGNRMLNKDNSVYDEVTSDNWNGISIKQSITDTYGVTKDTLKSDKSFQTIVNGENVSTADTCESAEDSYENVINFAGNGIAPDKRTAVDQQCAEETRTGTGNMSGTASYDEATDANKENIDKYHIECGVTYTYPEAVTKKTIVDKDNDGMDDDWELARGLDPNDPTDINGDYCGQGYTNIEYYINDLTVNSFPEGVVTLSPETSSGINNNISAFETIEAESFYDQNGVRIEDTTSGGQNIGFIENDDWIMFRKLSFEEVAKIINMRISGYTSKIEICLDSLDNVVSGINFAATAGFSDYQDLSYNIATIEG
ncbi:MAG: carbohydrate-binding protein, partial [Ruminococcus sp.]|nr:carbohydrate-binding protein [Ruminococcus sp.]